MTTTTMSKTQFFSVHIIDNKSDAPPKIDVSTDDIEQYTNKLFVQSLSAKNRRKYKFQRSSTEVAQIVHGLIGQINDPNIDITFQDKVDTIAQRLLTSQKTYTSKYPNVNAPKVGSLVSILQKRESQIDILFSKIDQENFLSIEDSLYKVGLPDNNATQKSCTISFRKVDEKYELIDIVVTDTRPTISKFWSEEFLELLELKDDENNTRESFNRIEQVLTRKVKSKSKRDYTELRNNLVGYYKTKDSFSYDGMIEYVIGKYKPESEEVSIDSLKKDMEKLRIKNQFDTSFSIRSEVIKSRFKRSYKITEKIELRTSDYIEDLKNVIIAKRNNFGEKVLEIKDINDDVYESFLKKED
jgi:hypothetical protein